MHFKQKLTAVYCICRLVGLLYVSLMWCLCVGVYTVCLYVMKRVSPLLVLFQFIPWENGKSSTNSNKIHNCETKSSLYFSCSVINRHAINVLMPSSIVVSHQRRMCKQILNCKISCQLQQYFEFYFGYYNQRAVRRTSQIVSIFHMLSGCIVILVDFRGTQCDYDLRVHWNKKRTKYANLILGR